MALVLIVEDKPDIRELLRLLVEKEGCSVVEAADGREALERARAVEPDLILMDLAMPVMDGLQASREIRRDARTSSIPIVAVTAHDDKREEAADAGCNECVRKPVSTSLLRTMLKKYVDSCK